MQRDPHGSKPARPRPASDSGKAIHSHHGLESRQTGRARSDRAGFSRGDAQSAMDQRHQLYLDRLDRRGVAVSRCGHGPGLTRQRGVVDAPTDDATIGGCRPDHGVVPPQRPQGHAHSLCSWQPVVVNARSAICSETPGWAAAWGATLPATITPSRRASCTP